MKKLLFILFALLVRESLNAQNIDSLVYLDQDDTGSAKSIGIDEASWHWTDTIANADYSKVDEYALGITKKYKNIQILAKDLTRPFTKDNEKVRAIFMWMVGNIAYDYVELARNKKSKGKNLTYSRKTSKSLLAQKWENIYYDYATQVLKNRRGICEGYSTLFYELCRAAGVICEMVNGYASGDLNKVNKYKKFKHCPTTHAWNRVFINNEWLYIDVTWASTGTFNGKRTEPKDYQPYYYLVSKANLYSTHIENTRKTLRRNELVGNY